MRQPQHLTRLGLARSSSVAMVGNLFVLGAGLLNFFVLAKTLRPDEYGVFGSVQAITAPALVLSTIGAPTLVLRRIAQGSDRNDAWARAVSMTITGGLATTLALVAAKPILLGNAPLLPYSLLVISYGILSLYPDLIFSYAMAVGSMELALTSRIVQHGPRILALIVFLFLDNQTLERWTWLALGTALFSTFVATALAGRAAGLKPRPTLHLHWFKEARQGYGFAMNGVSEGVLNASDRPVMYNAGFEADAGVYSAAYRLMNVALVPPLSLMHATTANVFAAGADGVRASRAMALRYLKVTIALGGASGLVLLLGAPLVDIFVNSEFDGVVTMLRWLSIVPVVKSVQYLAGNALDSAAKAIVRFWLTAAFALANLGANLILIPEYSWRGAIGTTIGAELGLTAALWLTLWHLARSERRAELKAFVWSI